jgi:hypothetical protein
MIAPQRPYLADYGRLPIRFYCPFIGTVRELISTIPSICARTPWFDSARRVCRSMLCIPPLEKA